MQNILSNIVLFKEYKHTKEIQNTKKSHEISSNAFSSHLANQIHVVFQL